MNSSPVGLPSLSVPWQGPFPHGCWARPRDLLWPMDISTCDPSRDLIQVGLSPGHSAATL